MWPTLRLEFIISEIVFGIGRITQLIALTGSGGLWRKTIIDKAVTYVICVSPIALFHALARTTSVEFNILIHSWSSKHGLYPAGDPDLHHYIGELLYKGSSPYLCPSPTPHISQ